MLGNLVCLISRGVCRAELWGGGPISFKFLPEKYPGVAGWGGGNDKLAIDKGGNLPEKGM